MPTIGTGTKINGLVYDYSSVEISINGLPYQGITEINYSDTMEPGTLRGTGALMRGRSRGLYEAEASFTMAKEDFDAVKNALVAMGLGGFMEAVFPITVNYREEGANMITDVIEGCRIKHNENSHSSGNADSLMHKVDLSVYRIKWNGAYGVSVPGQIGGLLSP
jgi:hypothetical protein